MRATTLGWLICLILICANCGDSDQKQDASVTSDTQISDIGVDAVVDAALPDLASDVGADLVVDSALPDISPDLSGESVGVNAPYTGVEVAKACIRIGSCSGTSINSCIAGIHGQDPIYWDRMACLANATDGCAGATSCVGAVVLPYGNCVGSASTCTGQAETLKVCDAANNLSADVDCAFNGSQCTTVGGGGACLQVGDTSGACAGQPDQTMTCAGSKPAVCFQGLPYGGSDCATLGLLCVGAGVCVGSTQACTPAVGKCLTADTIEYCPRGFKQQVNCSSLGPGYTCAISPTGDRCVRGASCTVTTPPSCNGTMLTVCVGGTPEVVDCAALGFSGCAAGLCTL